METTLGGGHSSAPSSPTQTAFEYTHMSESPVSFAIQADGIGAAGVPGFLDSVVITEAPYPYPIPYSTGFAPADCRVDPDTEYSSGPDGESWRNSTFLECISGRVSHCGAGFSPYSFTDSNNSVMSVGGICGLGLNLEFSAIKGSNPHALGNFIVDTFDAGPGRD